MQLLREDAERHEDGALIGSENMLLARYGVSRPTLRQAAALVAQEQLVRVRRGVSGGYFAARPTASAVSHMAAIYLRGRATRVSEMLHAVELIRGDMVRLAAESDNRPAREALAAWLAEQEASGAGDDDLNAFRKAERSYAQLIGDLCGNNLLSLFLEILLELLPMPRPDRTMPFTTPARRRAWAEQRSRVIRAVLDGDGARAMREAERGARQIGEWVDEDTALKDQRKSHVPARAEAGTALK